MHSNPLAGKITKSLYEAESGRWYIQVEKIQLKVPWRYGRPYKIQCDDLKPIMDYKVGDEVEVWWELSQSRMILARIRLNILLSNSNN
jgi:hypothetical protein